MTDAEYLRLFEEGRHGSNKPAGILRGIRKCLAASAGMEPAAEKYDDVLLPFLAMMRAELHANAHKGDRPGWLDMTSDEAMAEITYHLTKLRKQLAKGDEDRVREHAADVANGCLMLVDLCGLLVPAAPVEPQS